MQRLDQDEEHLKILVYGMTGTGKSSLGVTAERPLIILTERQGIAAIKGAARRLGKPVPYVVFAETVDDFAELAQALKSPKDDGEGGLVLGGGLVCPYYPDTIVLDSVTDFVNNMLWEQVCRDVTTTPLGEPEDGWAAFRLLGKRATRWLRGFRNLPFHVLFLAQRSDRTDEKTGIHSVGPDIMGKTKVQLQGMTVMVAIATREQVATDDGMRIEWMVRTKGPSYMDQKSMEPLQEVEAPDMANWLRRRKAWLDEGLLVSDEPIASVDEDAEDEAEDAMMMCVNEGEAVDDANNYPAQELQDVL